MQLASELYNTLIAQILGQQFLSTTFSSVAPTLFTSTTTSLINHCLDEELLSQEIYENDILQPLIKRDMVLPVMMLIDSRHIRKDLLEDVITAFIN